MNISKYLITLLTSSNSKLLKLSYNTIKKQINHNFNYTIVIVVNTLNTGYFEEVLNEFKDIEVEIIETESNGKPGKGHNSLFEIFKKKKQYDYLIPIDGDDFLYPYAFHQLSKIIDSKNPDILVLQGNDILSWYNDSTNSTDIYLNNCFYLIKQDEYPDNKWKFNKNSVNINPFIKNNKFITPIRLILCNRKILNLNITHFYCEKCNVLDDYLFYLHFINIYIKNLLNIFIINSNHIYLYNDLSILSVHNTLDLNNDYEYIESYQSNFSDIINYFGNNWNVLELPFYYIEPPFNKKYTDYKIVEESIQILDYNEYLENNNTKYCIDFSNDIVLKLYNIFKSNIDFWLSKNDLDKVFNLTKKFIDNNCSDREIYLYICIYGVLSKNEDLIYKYITYSLPLSYNYNFLLKYIK
tara:strand:+ start:2211 stop:3443 length:1233 start_codon:yes stop_codon:yes gene_type:complete